jgi:hypothetical protein
VRLIHSRRILLEWEGGACGCSVRSLVDLTWQVRPLHRLIKDWWQKAFSSSGVSLLVVRPGQLLLSVCSNIFFTEVISSQAEMRHVTV